MIVEDLIKEWWGKPGGQEKSNFASFIPDLCEVLGVERPKQSEKDKLGSYEYEASVPGGSFRSTKGTGAIDLYKRGHFIMEAKQSYLKPEQTPLDLGDSDQRSRAPSGARYDVLMRDAWLQARNYARNLPSSEPVSPFLIVCDVGRAFELYVDPAGNGRDYEYFPDRQSYRIELTDLASDSEVARTGKTALELLLAIWTDPRSVDPRFQSAAVTRQVATNLAEVSKYLEEGIKAKGLSKADQALEIEEASLFLMRVLFCMFAEDIELLPRRSFEEFLKEAEGNDGYFANGLRDLFEKMNNADPGNRFSMALKTDVRYFNGGLFEDSRTYQLGGFLVHNLYEAARQNWRRVEPAIFGTLLEQALSGEDRAKLGAHYTPRPYVITLVRATIMDVLEPEWEAIEALPMAEVLPAAAAFHDRLATLRVLDPACGTGNFLYVAMELLQALESKVIERIQTLGGDAQPRVGPHQFHGLELNPRAAKIAELVLWIGWLRNRLKDDPDAVPEPVLQRGASINFGKHGGYDAVLLRKETGEPDFANPTIPPWPEAEFIVGNPPFIGGKDIRRNLGGEYAEALWAANPRVPKSADFVMQWWDRAANSLVALGSPLQRFGFVTTNSITQTFSRRVIEAYLKDRQISLLLAIPDHPWTKASKDAAAVRIAMTVAVLGAEDGQLVEVVHEAGLTSDDPLLETRSTVGKINPDLSLGSDVTRALPLKANEGLASPGVKLHGNGFIVTASEAEMLGLGRREGLELYIRPYRNGRDLLQRSRDVMVIDLFGLHEREVRLRFPEVYQHLMRTVRNSRQDVIDEKLSKGEKPSKDAIVYFEQWWLMGKSRPELRSALTGLHRYIATVETARHRVFQFVDQSVLPDNKITVLTFETSMELGVLCSEIHQQWTFARCGLIGMANFEAGHVYVKSSIFDPFPFPDPTPEQRAAIAELAEELDATRKAALAEVPGLTMTEIYNWRDKLRSKTKLSPQDQARATAARAGIVDQIHNQLDAAVAAAYGWPADLPPAEIVTRLVALNAERADEERQGKVRWLRPDYQIPRFGGK
ncbi:MULTISPECIES: DNA methyltransferase [unclassified Novosphingobium]|uniref:class I SAM-dependent DNA methyltransferase n=1 Tax=unclassified Novosphingobium TaxID=2644732 RepID=UPI000ED00EC3|nr:MULTISPECIES: DNA methyltransferase [unclassified Novosphingobium]HCF24960.1 class I SAM-dependent DNA methyltransferase [Novosphingobium sp.]HQV03130.1 class I SAM-dependent DNA methyltransferase [Novosphingobium sp.]